MIFVRIPLLSSTIWLIIMILYQNQEARYRINNYYHKTYLIVT